jgi:hypothetical protein
LNDITPCLQTANRLDFRSSNFTEGTLDDGVYGSEAEPDVRIIYISDLGKSLEAYKILRVHWWKCVKLPYDWFILLVRRVGFRRLAFVEAPHAASHGFPSVLPEPSYKLGPDDHRNLFATIYASEFCKPPSVVPS